jgi:hypothetical protein
LFADTFKAVDVVVDDDGVDVMENDDGDDADDDEG